MRHLSLLPVALAVSLAAAGQSRPASVAVEPPRGYVCYRATQPPVIDGKLDDAAWRAAPWSRDFVDIEGDIRPAPALRTRMKLLWDDKYLYVAGELDEPHVWATLTARDSVIFHDNDFEMFIDPDGDTHEYYEIEVNALNTVWDLFLVRPYRDGGPPINGWDIAGLRSAVAIDGTINRPADRDRGWSVEMAMPWAALAEAAPEHRQPRSGEYYWRINFSRVEWDVDTASGAYVKRTNPATGQPLPEHNWVWSPQGVVDMHRPEKWGIVQFADTVAGQGEVPFVRPPDEDVRFALRAVYDAEHAYLKAHGRYAADLGALGLTAAAWSRPAGFRLEATDDRFEARADGRAAGTVWRIREDGRIWASR